MELKKHNELNNYNVTYTQKSSELTEVKVISPTDECWSCFISAVALDIHNRTVVIPGQELKKELTLHAELRKKGSIRKPNSTANPSTKTGLAVTESLLEVLRNQEIEKKRRMQDKHESQKRAALQKHLADEEASRTAEELTSIFKTGSQEWKKMSAQKLRSACRGFALKGLGSSTKKDELIKALEAYLLSKHTVSEPRPARETKRPSYLDE